MTESAKARGLLLALVAALALPVSAQVLYKLVDRHGRVTYTDRKPANFDGQVTVLAPDAAANTAASPRAHEDSPVAGADSGLAKERRQNRQLLEEKLREARARVESARQAKEQATEIRAEELRTILTRYPPLERGQQSPNANCFAAEDPLGNAFLNCPRRAPQEAYFERQRKLGEELGSAEEELELAERAYRRGTD